MNTNNPNDRWAPETKIDFFDQDVFTSFFSIHRKTEEEFLEKREELHKKFSNNFIENKVIHDNVSNRVYKSLLYDASPYSIIENLIDIITEQQKTIFEVTRNIPPELILKK